MKKFFPTPEARKAAIKSLEDFRSGQIDKTEFTRQLRRLRMLHFEKLPSDGYKCFLVINHKGWHYAHPLIEKYQNIPKENIPEGAVIFE